MGQEVVGVRIESHIGEVTKEVKDKIEAWLEAVGEDASGVASDKAPYDTGRLRNSITHQVEMGEEQAVYVGTNVKYAKWHEIGTGVYAEGGGGRTKPWAFKDSKGNWHYTKGVPARHYLQFGITAHKDQYKAMLESELKNG